MATAADPRIRHHLEPGDVAAIADLHHRVFCEEQHFASHLVQTVRRSVEVTATRGWPEAGGVWLVELNHQVAGSLALTFEGQAGDGAFIGQARWFALDRALRGTGLARRMFEGLLETAEDQGIDRVELYTLGELEPAARLFVACGFGLTHERERLDMRADGTPVLYQHYVAELS